MRVSAAAATYSDLLGLMTLVTGDEKHAPSATSTLDAIWVLYDRVLRVSPAIVDGPDRDRFVLSKGHGPMAYCAVLAHLRMVRRSSEPSCSRWEPNRLGA